MSAPRILEHQALADIELVSATISTPKPTTHFDIPVSPLPHVRMSESTVARHQFFSPKSRSYLDCSPYASNPSTAVNSRAPSPIKGIYSECDLPLTQDRLKWRLASGFFACFIGGWADGDLSKEFHLTSTMSSSLFAGTTCGFFLGTFLVELIITVFSRFHLHRFIMIVLKKNKSDEGFEIHRSNSQARHLVLLIASIAHAMYSVMGSRSGFPVMFLTYVVSAFSRALLTAPLYAYFAEGPKQALGYGLGNVISPLVCQSIIATGVSTMTPWFFQSSILRFCLSPSNLHQKAFNDSRRQDLFNFLRHACWSFFSRRRWGVSCHLGSHIQYRCQTPQHAPPCSCDAVSFFILLYFWGSLFSMFPFLCLGFSARIDR